MTFEPNSLETEISMAFVTLETEISMAFVTLKTILFPIVHTGNQFISLIFLQACPYTEIPSSLKRRIGIFTSSNCMILAV